MSAKNGRQALDHLREGDYTRLSFVPMNDRETMHRNKSQAILDLSYELVLRPVRRAKTSNIFVSSEHRRIALAEGGVTVVAHITKDRDLVAWAKCTDRAVYIGRDIRGWRGTGWGNPFRPQTHAPEEHDRVVGLYSRFLEDNPILLAQLPELSGGKVLLCGCHPLPCHGDLLAKRANVQFPVLQLTAHTMGQF